MNNNKNFLNIENDFEKFDSKYNKNKLNISFNRISFIFFTFALVLIIFSLKAFYLTGKKLPKNNIIGTKKEIRSSILDRNNKIPIHTAPGNRDTKRLRIHIPLIIPKNTGWKQLGFESEGTRMVWDEVWGFDNQSLHSAWNYTNERRLVFIFDLDRDFLGLPPAPKRLFKNGTWSNFAIQYTRRALRWHF